MLVYEKLGVGLLRYAWFNIDLFWMLALMIAGLVYPFSLNRDGEETKLSKQQPSSPDQLIHQRRLALIKV